MDEHNRRLRKNILINKSLQFRIILMSMLYMFMVMIVTTGVILLQPLYDMFMSSDLNIQYAAAKTFLILAKQLMPAAVCVFALFFFHHLFVTHRICGPMVNFRHTFRKIAQGDLTRKVVLRKKDYLKEESEAINAMIDGLTDHLKKIQSDQAALIQSLEAGIAKIQNEETRKEIQAIAAHLKETSNSISPQPAEEA